jgi:hypothetical protein
MEIKARIMYYPEMVKELAIQCPHCEFWFDQSDIILGGSICYAYRLETASYNDCPVCGATIGCSEKDLVAVDIETCDSKQEVHRETLHKKIEWVREVGI